MPMMPRRGQARWARQRKSCASSSSLGWRKAVTATPSGPVRVEDAADGAVLAGGVHALQHHQQRALALGVEPVLQLVDRHDVFGQFGPGVLLALERGGVGRVASASFAFLPGLT